MQMCHYLVRFQCHAAPNRTVQVIYLFIYLLYGLYTR